MKHVIFFTLFLCCCLQANGQDYLKLADECFEKGDYDCAKRNYTIFQTWDGRDMSAQIQKAEECIRIMILADGYFKDKEYEKAKERYEIVLEKNPKDPYAKRQYGLCEEQLKSESENVAADESKISDIVNLPVQVDKKPDNPPSTGMSSSNRNVKSVPRANSNAKFKLGANFGLQTFDDEFEIGFGGGISGEYLVTPKIGIGLNAGYYFWKEEYSDWGLSYYLIPVTVTGKYYFLTKNIQPYGGVDVGLYQESDDFEYWDLYFGFAPVVGLQFKLFNALALDVNAKYNLFYRDRKSFGILGLNIGFVYTFGK